MKAQLKDTEILQDLIKADSIVSFALWSELPNSHPVSELWTETQPDLQASIYLAYGGFFRQALIILRSWFEISVHGVFFSAHYGQPTERYEQWRKGKRNSPAKMKEISEALASRQDKLIPVDQATILQKIDPIYSFLSDQTHAQGLDIYDLQEGRDNVPRYLPKSYKIWHSKMLSSFDAICFLYRVFFSRELGNYLRKDPNEQKYLRKLSKQLGKRMPEFKSLVSDAFSSF